MAENKIYYCCITGKPIPEMRVEALQFLGVPEDRWTIVQASTVKKKKGLFTEDNKLIICDKVYNDSVRSVFRSAEAESKGDNVKDEIDEHVAKELKLDTDEGDENA